MLAAYTGRPLGPGNKALLINYERNLGGCCLGKECFAEARGADEFDRLVHDLFGFHIRPLAFAKSDGYVDVFPIEIDQSAGGDEPNLCIRMFRVPVHQTRHQKTRGKSETARNGKQGSRLGAYLGQPVRNHLKPFREFWQKQPALRGGNQARIRPVEQRYLELRLKQT